MSESSRVVGVEIEEIYSDRENGKETGRVANSMLCLRSRDKLAHIAKPFACPADPSQIFCLLSISSPMLLWVYCNLQYLLQGRHYEHTTARQRSARSQHRTLSRHSFPH